MIIKEINCGSLLNKTGLPFDYCINPYVGCSNGCVYCYARFMIKYTKHKEDWGSFIDVKTNALETLKKELRTKKPGSIFISSVTDPYQGIEKKYKITRKVLENLPETFEPCILTKSSLVERDIDVFKKFRKIEVGITLTTLEDWKNFEPRASNPEGRIKALRKIHEAGINTYVFLGPVLPYITDKDLNGIMEKISFVDEVMVDRLKIKSGNWLGIRKVLVNKYPDFLEGFSKAVFEDNGYYSDFKRKVKSLRNRVTFYY